MQNRYRLNYRPFACREAIFIVLLMLPLNAKTPALVSPAGASASNRLIRWSVMLAQGKLLKCTRRYSPKLCRFFAISRESGRCLA